MDEWDIARELLEMPDESCRHVQTGAILLGAISVGPVNKKVKLYTGAPLDQVLRVGYRLRAAGIWGRGWIHYPWLHEITDGNTDLGVVGFVLDVFVGTGETVRDADGKYARSLIGEGQGAPAYDSPRPNLPARSALVKPCTCEGLPTRGRNARGAA